MNCPHCGTEYKEGWKFCVNCAKPLPAFESKKEVTKQPPITPKEKNKKDAIGFILVVVLIIAGTMMFISGTNKSPTPSQSSTTTQASTPAKTETKPPSKVENWQYNEKDDTIHNAKVKFARTTSVNTLNFKFPYAGPQHAYLLIRKNYDGSKDVMITIEKGQFMHTVLGGKALVRFDDISPEEFQLLGTKDNSTTTVFIKYADYFIKNLAKSKKVYIQTDFYQEGSPTLEFNVEGLSEL